MIQVKWWKIAQLSELKPLYKVKRVFLQEEKPASIACKIDGISNLKFLKLLPGPVSGGWTSGSGLVGWLSVIIVLLFPIELFFAFQTHIPKQKS
jgi:hypothetical protein